GARFADAAADQIHHAGDSRRRVDGCQSRVDALPDASVVSAEPADVGEGTTLARDDRESSLPPGRMSDGCVSAATTVDGSVLHAVRTRRIRHAQGSEVPEVRQ